jgi:tetratricopeptide (TPR) repeat protein
LFERIRRRRRDSGGRPPAIRVGRVPGSDKVDLHVSMQGFTEAAESYGRGLELFHAGEHGAAEEAFSAAIDQNPDWYEPYVDRGVVYALLGKKRKALSDLKKAVEKNPTDERARTLLAAAKAGDWPTG